MFIHIMIIIGDYYWKNNIFFLLFLQFLHHFEIYFPAYLLLFVVLYTYLINSVVYEKYPV